MKKATIMGYAFEVDGIYYGINDDGKTVYVTSGDIEYSGEVAIPSTVTYDSTTYSVTSIGEKAFSGCSGLMSVTIPESVTSIGEDAFAYCIGLMSVTIPESVTEIGYSAFEGCSGLTSVTIPESVTKIGYKAFYGCRGLTSVTIPESVASIGDSAFKGCTGLMSFTSLNVIPPTLPGETTFEGMPGSCQLYVPESSVMAYQTSTGWTFFSHVNGMPDSGVDAIETEAR